MSTGKKANTEILICVALGVIILLLGITASIIFVSKKKGQNLPENTNVITSGLVYSASENSQVYDKPSQIGTVLLQVAKDEQIIFISYADNGFYRVKAGNVSGYMNGDYVIDKNLIHNLQESIKVNMYVANTQQPVHMYAEASVTSAILQDVDFGITVAVFSNADNNGMKKVEYNGKTGYIEQQYITDNYSVVQNQQQENENKKKAEEERKKQESLPVGSNATALKYPMWVCNVNEAIYLRTKPSEAAEIITTIPLNTRVYYVDTCEGSWCKISYNGQMGYSKAQYLTTQDPTYTPSYRNSSVRQVTGVAQAAYLRRNPNGSTDPSNIICEVPNGTFVTYLGQTGDYCKVRYNGYVGYITGQYLR